MTSSEAASTHAEAGATKASACQRARPCDLTAALRTADATGEEIQLAAGVYRAPRGLRLGDSAELSGPLRGSATIIGSGSRPVLRAVGEGSEVKDVRVRNAGAGPALALEDGADATRVRATAASGVACRLGDGTVLLSSFCALEGEGAAVDLSSTSGDVEAVALNVTASAPEGDAFRVLGGEGAFAHLRALNSVGIGENAVRTRRDNDWDQSVLFSYDTLVLQGNHMLAGTESVEPSLSDRTPCCAPPRLVDPDGGDLHQLPYSGTINEGKEFRGMGGRDVDGDRRIEDGQIDVGADEMTGLPPITSVTFARPRIVTKDRFVRPVISLTANPAAGGLGDLSDFTFEFRRIGRGGWRDTPPSFRPRFKSGNPALRYTLLFRATDADGDVDETPDYLTFRIKRRR